jgi:hypothetical protein
MVTNFFVNSASSLANGAWSLAKGVAPMIAVNLVTGIITGIVFSTDAATREKGILTEQHHTLARKAIGIQALAKEKADAIGKLENEIKIIEESELTNNLTIKNILKFIFSISLFNLINTCKKWGLQNQVKQLSAEYVPIEQSFTETDNKIQEIQKKTAELNEQIQSQTHKQNAVRLAIMLLVYPNLNSIMNTIYPKLGYEPAPTGAALNAAKVIEVLNQNSPSAEATLASSITAACGKVYPYPCPINFQHYERGAFCKAVSLLTDSSWSQVLKRAAYELCTFPRTLAISN